MHASSSESRPPRTAATTSALHRMTQRFVSDAGRSAIVSGQPSGPMTYVNLARRLSDMTLTRTIQLNLCVLTSTPQAIAGFGDAQRLYVPCRVLSIQLVRRLRPFSLMD